MPALTRPALAAACLLMAGACSSTSTPPSKTALSPAPAGSSAAAPAGGQTVNATSTKDVSGVTSVAVEAVNFAFTPSSLVGKPGQRITLMVHNGTTTPHNITVKEQKVNDDLATGKTVPVTLTFPASGQLFFTCEYHAARGMAGTLGTSAAAPGATGAGTTSTTGGSTGY